MELVELVACTGPNTTLLVEDSAPRACTRPELHIDPAEGACTGPTFPAPLEDAPEACTGPDPLEVPERRLKLDLISTSLVAELDDSSPSFETTA